MIRGTSLLLGLIKDSHTRLILIETCRAMARIASFASSLPRVGDEQLPVRPFPNGVKRYLSGGDRCLPVGYAAPQSLLDEALKVDKGTKSKPCASVLQSHLPIESFVATMRWLSGDRKSNRAEKSAFREVIVYSSRYVLQPGNFGSFSAETTRAARSLGIARYSVLDVDYPPQAIASLLVLLHDVASHQMATSANGAMLRNWQKKLQRVNFWSAASVVDTLLCHGIDKGPVLHLLACRVVVLSEPSRLHQLSPHILLSVAEALSGHHAISQGYLKRLLGHHWDLLCPHPLASSAATHPASGDRWRAPLSLLCDAVGLDPRVSGNLVTMASLFLTSRIISEVIRAKSYLCVDSLAVDSGAMAKVAYRLIGMEPPPEGGTALNPLVMLAGLSSGHVSLSSLNVQTEIQHLSNLAFDIMDLNIQDSHAADCVFRRACDIILLYLRDHASHISESDVDTARKLASFVALGQWRRQITGPGPFRFMGPWIRLTKMLRMFLPSTPSSPPPSLSTSPGPREDRPVRLWPQLHASAREALSILKEFGVSHDLVLYGTSSLKYRGQRQFVALRQASPSVFLSIVKKQGSISVATPNSWDPGHWDPGQNLETDLSDVSAAVLELESSLRPELDQLSPSSRHATESFMHDLDAHSSVLSEVQTPQKCLPGLQRVKAGLSDLITLVEPSMQRQDLILTMGTVYGLSTLARSESLSVRDKHELQHLVSDLRHRITTALLVHLNDGCDVQWSPSDLLATIEVTRGRLKRDPEFASSVILLATARLEATLGTCLEYTDSDIGAQLVPRSAHVLSTTLDHLHIRVLPNTTEATLVKLSEALRVSPILFSAWSMALTDQPYKPNASEELELLDSISAAALDHLEYFENIRLGRLILAIALAGGSFSSPIQRELLLSGWRHLISHTESKLPSYPMSLLSQPLNWSSLTVPPPLECTLDIMCAAAAAGVGDIHDWAFAAACRLDREWSEASKACQLDHRTSPVSAMLPSSAISWMDGGPPTGSSTSEMPDARCLVDGLWALNELFPPSCEDSVATIDLKHRVSQSAEALLMVLLRHEHLRPKAVDSARILAYLTELDSPLSLTLSADCLNDIGDMIDDALKRL